MRGDFLFVSHGISMLTLAAMLVGLWLLGMITSFTLGGMIHVILVVAAVMAMVRIVQGPRPI